MSNVKNIVAGILENAINDTEVQPVIAFNSIIDGGIGSCNWYAEHDASTPYHENPFFEEKVIRDREREEVSAVCYSRELFILHIDNMDLEGTIGQLRRAGFEIGFDIKPVFRQLKMGSPEYEVAFKQFMALRREEAERQGIPFIEMKRQLTSELMVYRQAGFPGIQLTIWSRHFDYGDDCESVA